MVDIRMFVIHPNLEISHWVSLILYSPKSWHLKRHKKLWPQEEQSLFLTNQAVCQNWLWFVGDLHLFKEISSLEHHKVISNHSNFTARHSIQIFVEDLKGHILIFICRWAVDQIIKYIDFGQVFQYGQASNPSLRTRCRVKGGKFNISKVNSIFIDCSHVLLRDQCSNWCDTHFYGFPQRSSLNLILHQYVKTM